MDETHNDIKEYELAFLARTEAEVHKGLDVARRSGAEIFFESPAERITLTHPVDRETSAFFGYVHLRAAPASVPSLTNSLHTNHLFLRFLVVTPPFMKPKPRPSFRPRTREGIVSAPQGERVSPTSLPLSNEALEKKIEEILKE